MAPDVKGNRAAVERHHLFPKGFLKNQGITEIRDTNQIANFALVEWGDNAAIGDQAPYDYLPALEGNFSSTELRKMYSWHALPEGWEKMAYSEFLENRRELMARTIRDACEKLEPGSSDVHEEPELSLQELVAVGESSEIEFKSTLRVNLHTGKTDPRMEHTCIKTIAGFLNMDGGKLIIGVSDDGSPIGIAQDNFQSEDKMNLHLGNLVRDRIGPQFMRFIHPRFDDYLGKRVMEVDCQPSRSPACVKDGSDEYFYVRSGASTAELTTSQALEFIGQRFR